MVVSQVPQVPSVQENGAGTPAAPAPSRVLRPGGEGGAPAAPERALEGRGGPAGLDRLRREALDVQAAGRPVPDRACEGREHRLRPAGVDERAGTGVREEAGERGQAALVL